MVIFVKPSSELTQASAVRCSMLTWQEVMLSEVSGPRPPKVQCWMVSCGLPVTHWESLVLIRTKLRGIPDSQRHRACNLVSERRGWVNDGTGGEWQVVLVHPSCQVIHLKWKYHGEREWQSPLRDWFQSVSPHAGAVDSGRLAAAP